MQQERRQKTEIFGKVFFRFFLLLITLIFHRAYTNWNVHHNTNAYTLSQTTMEQIFVSVLFFHRVHYEIWRDDYTAFRYISSVLEGSRAAVLEFNRSNNKNLKHFSYTRFEQTACHGKSLLLLLFFDSGETGLIKFGMLSTRCKSHSWFLLCFAWMLCVWRVVSFFFLSHRTEWNCANAKFGSTTVLYECMGVRVKYWFFRLYYYINSGKNKRNVKKVLASRFQIRNRGNIKMVDNNQNNIKAIFIHFSEFFLLSFISSFNWMQ